MAIRWVRLKNATLHPVVEYQVQKAKRAHRKQYPACLVCGATKDFGKKCAVHHALPVHVRPDLACTESNLHTLCARHHLWAGHLGSYHDFNSNLKATVNALRLAYSNNKASGKHPPPTWVGGTASEVE